MKKKKEEIDEILIHKLIEPPFERKALAAWKPGNICKQKGPGSSSWKHVNCQNCLILKPN